MLLVVLLKLKLNLGFQDIAYRMGISKATVSRQFHETLDVMYTQLEWLTSGLKEQNCKKQCLIVSRLLMELKL